MNWPQAFAAAGYTVLVMATIVCLCSWLVLFGGDSEFPRNGWDMLWLVLLTIACVFFGAGVS